MLLWQREEGKEFYFVYWLWVFTFFVLPNHSENNIQHIFPICRVLSVSFEVVLTLLLLLLLLTVPQKTCHTIDGWVNRFWPGICFFQMSCHTCQLHALRGFLWIIHIICLERRLSTALYQLFKMAFQKSVSKYHPEWHLSDLTHRPAGGFLLTSKTKSLKKIK